VETERGGGALVRTVARHSNVEFWRATHAPLDIGMSSYKRALVALRQWTQPPDGRAINSGACSRPVGGAISASKNPAVCEAFESSMCCRLTERHDRAVNRNMAGAAEKKILDVTITRFAHPISMQTVVNSLAAQCARLIQRRAILSISQLREASRRQNPARSNSSAFAHIPHNASRSRRAARNGRTVQPWRGA